MSKSVSFYKEKVTKENYNKNWYLISPQAISRYLFSTFKNWGFFVSWNQSDDSESRYLKVNLTESGQPKSLYVRISNHSVSQKNLGIPYNVDLYCSYEREDATSYVKFLTKLSGKLNKPLPSGWNRIKTGTPSYKRYKIQMQQWPKSNNKSICMDRLYV